MNNEQHRAWSVEAYYRGFPKFSAQGVSDSDRRYRMTYRDQHCGADNQACGDRHELTAPGLTGRRAGHRVFAVVSEQVVSSRIACGGVLGVPERPRALRFPESSWPHAPAASEFLHGRDVFAAQRRIVQDAVVAEGDTLMHDRPLAPKDDIPG